MKNGTFLFPDFAQLHRFYVNKLTGFNMSSRDIESVPNAFSKNAKTFDYFFIAITTYLYFVPFNVLF